MDAKRRSRKRDALLISSEGLLDIKLFEFLERFIQKDMAVEHVFNHSFEAGADLHSVRVLICRGNFVGLTESAVITDCHLATRVRRSSIRKLPSNVWSSLQRSRVA